jgi:membrane-bound ClpP family serine protease
MSNELIWPSLCMAIGLILLIAEVFVPSGGLIGLLAAGLLVVSLYLAFSHSTWTGVEFLFALGCLLPLTLVLAVNLWPRTPMARWIFLKPPEPEDFRPDVEKQPLEHLIGQFGRSLTPLRPSGVVDFEGHRHDGLSEEGLIPAGVLVQAVALRANQVIVRLAPQQTLDELGQLT